MKIKALVVYTQFTNIFISYVPILLHSILIIVFGRIITKRYIYGGKGIRQGSSYNYEWQISIHLLHALTGFKTNF